jgi:hypothetical protein
MGRVHMNMYLGGKLPASEYDQRSKHVAGIHAEACLVPRQQRRDLPANVPTSARMLGVFCNPSELFLPIPSPFATPALSHCLPLALQR